MKKWYSLFIIIPTFLFSTSIVSSCANSNEHINWDDYILTSSDWKKILKHENELTFTIKNTKQIISDVLKENNSDISNFFDTNIFINKYFTDIKIKLFKDQCKGYSMFFLTKDLDPSKDIPYGKAVPMLERDSINKNDPFKTTFREYLSDFDNGEGVTDLESLNNKYNIYVTLGNGDFLFYNDIPKNYVKVNFQNW